MNVWLKIRRSHLIWKAPEKYLNVRVWMEVVWLRERERERESDPHYTFILFIIFIYYIKTVYLKLENSCNSTKHLESSLYQLKNNKDNGNNNNKKQQQQTNSNYSNNNNNTTKLMKMFNKHWSEVTMPNQIKSSRWIYVSVCFSIFNFVFKRY